MSFTVPNAVSLTDPLAGLDSGDLAILAAGSAQSGVLSGCAVTAQLPQVMAVTVASGSIVVAGVTAAVTGGNLTITTADTVNGRYDLIIASNTGVLSVATGTPATMPAYPAIPANSVVLAMVYVASIVTSIGSSVIVDKRLFVKLAALPTRPSLLIAANNAPSLLKASADYVCTGTNDHTTINTAIATLSNTGGTVMLTEGDYYLSGSITNASGMYQGLRIIGAGWGTVLHLTAGANCYAIAFYQSGNGMAGAQISNLKIDANGANQTTGGGGIDGYGAYRCLFDHLWIHQPYNEAIHLHYGPGGGFGFQNWVRSCYIEDGIHSASGTGRGVYMDNTDENFIVHTLFQDCGRTGASDPAAVLDTAGLQTIANCVFVGGYFGVKLQGAHNKVENCTFDGVHNYAVRLNGYKNLIQNNVFYNIGAGAASANTISGIYCDNVQYCQISGNLFRNDVTASNGTKSFVEFDFNSTLETVRGNIFMVETGSVAAMITYNGCTGNIVQANQNYLTETSSTATIAQTATTITVTHGLALTPTRVQVTPQVNPGSVWWVSNKTSTQFTLNLASAAPSGGVAFDWHAQVGEG